MPVKKCKTCGKEFTVPRCREKEAKYCSAQCRVEGMKKPLVSGVCEKCGSAFERTRRARINKRFCSNRCRDEHHKLNATPNTSCSHCGSDFYLKPSARHGRRSHGFFCTAACYNEFKKAAYHGSKNPNYKGRNIDCDGYRIYSPPAPNYLHKGKKLHQAMVFEYLEIESIPPGYHIHHRDCDPLNNSLENLVVLSISDHKWLHKQFGSATLWALTKGRIDIESLIYWSNDHDRAKKLLPLSVRDQKGVCFIKEAA